MITYTQDLSIHHTGSTTILTFFLLPSPHNLISQTSTPCSLQTTITILFFTFLHSHTTVHKTFQLTQSTVPSTLWPFSKKCLALSNDYKLIVSTNILHTRNTSLIIHKTLSQHLSSKRINLQIPTIHFFISTHAIFQQTSQTYEIKPEI